MCLNTRLAQIPPMEREWMTFKEVCVPDSGMKAPANQRRSPELCTEEAP